jgi:hypothetical protein
MSSQNAQSETQSEMSSGLLKILPPWSIKAATMVLGSYQETRVSDPKLWIATSAATLSTFPPEVVKEVCDPRFGIQTREEWPPNAAKFRAASEKVLGERQTRERRDYLNEHRVLIDTPRGPMPEHDAERLRLAGPAQRATEHLRLTGPGQDEQRTFSGAEFVDRTLRTLYVRMAEADRSAKRARPPGTTRARVDVEEMLKIKLGGDIERFRVVVGFLLDRPDVYHEVVEARRQDNGVTGAAWRLLVQRVNDAALKFSLRVPPPRMSDSRPSASPEERERVAEHWEKLRPFIKEPARQKRDEPPPGMTEDERKAWYGRRVEELSGQPLPPLSAKLAAYLAEKPDASTAQPPRFLDAAE